MEVAHGDVASVLLRRRLPTFPFGKVATFAPTAKLATIREGLIMNELFAEMQVLLFVMPKNDRE